MKIYYTNIIDVSEEESQSIPCLLPTERRERILRMKTEKSRLQSMTAGLLLEYALAEIGVSGKEMTFLKNADGKPQIKELPNFHYNLSHCEQYAALVTDECEVGIDVEGMHKESRKLVKRFFSEEEKQVLLEDWSEDLFTKMWTRKESFLKVTGFGMRMPLNAFSVLKETVERNEKMPLKMVSAQEHYYLKSIPLAEYVWLSVCRRNKPIEEMQLKLIELKVRT